MIVRILGEGQFEVDEKLRGRLEGLDAEVEARFQANDEEGFDKALLDAAGRGALGGLAGRSDDDRALGPRRAARRIEPP